MVWYEHVDMECLSMPCLRRINETPNKIARCTGALFYSRTAQYRRAHIPGLWRLPLPPVPVIAIDNGLVITPPNILNSIELSVRRSQDSFQKVTRYSKMPIALCIARLPSVMWRTAQCAACTDSVYVTP